eukprot:sb/3475901/
MVGCLLLVAWCAVCGAYVNIPSVSVQRVYRNGKLVMTGQSLLVKGDVIVLSPGEEAPAVCTSIDGSISLEKGDIYTEQDQHINLATNKETEHSHCKVESVKMPKLFTIHETEYLQLADTFLR